jgi:Ca2+:H+ antiporter
MRRATEQLAVAAGPAIGGLLNVSFGSAAELILALFVLLGEHAEIVRAQINGSIIGTSLLDLGLACFTGGVSRNNMSFSRARAGNLSSLLLIVVFALLLLAVFDQADVAHAATVNQRIASEGALSIGVAVCAELVSGSLESFISRFFSSGWFCLRWSVPPRTCSRV